MFVPQPNLARMSYQVQDNLTVGMCPKCHFRLELLAQDSVVVNFTIDG